VIGQDYTEKLVQFASGDPRVIAVYVFGSAASGRDRSRSDLDVAFMVREEIPPFERIDMETVLSNSLGRDVDLVIFDSASPLLRHEILKGSLVYEGDTHERVKREVFARFEYFDTLTLHKEMAGADHDR
jgi:uncharacterized protein